MELIPLVCPKCGGPLTEGRETKCEWCGTKFISSEKKSTPRIVNKPRQYYGSGSPSISMSEGPTPTVSYSWSVSDSPSPSPSAPPPEYKNYLVRKMAEHKFKMFVEYRRK